MCILIVMRPAPHHIPLVRPVLIGAAAMVLMLITVGLGITLGVQTRAQFREIEASWAAYANDAERKGALISDIRGFLGYGGIIHNFKNYVLRQDTAYLARTRAQIEAFREAVAAFRDLPLSRREDSVIREIEATVARYESRLPIAIAAAERGWPPTRTDPLVRVDDTGAIAGLASLERVWRASQERSTARIFAAVGQGNALIWIGFLSIAALVCAAMILGGLLIVLVRDLRHVIGDLSNELAQRRKLERSQARLATIVEQSPATIILTDTQARIEYANRKFEELTGWARTEVLGRTPAFLQSGETTGAKYQGIRETLAQGDRWQGVFRNLRKDGSSYWAETTILPLKARDGSVHSFVGIGEDVTETRRAREQVVRAQKLEAVGQLAGGVAHDFNNILTTIVGASHLAAMDAPEGSDLAHEIDQIGIAARRAQALVRELLTFARREPGEPQPVVLFDIVAEVVALLRASVPPFITIEAEPPSSGRLAVMGDPTHLHQIIMNLCRNAAEALGGDAGTVRITLARSKPPQGAEAHAEGWVRMEVADTGPGMTADTQAHLFEPFFTTKPLGKGSGLGLAVVFGLVEEVGGRISVDSAPGQGAVFSIWFPATDREVDENMAPDAPLPRGNERIILIDDEAEVAGTFRRQLQRLGYRVEAFTSPLVALERFRAESGRFDLAISDLVMPHVSGEELVTRFRRIRADMPVIFCSGYKPSQIAVPGAPPDVLDKPVDPGVLARRVRAVLDARARQ